MKLCRYKDEWYPVYGLEPAENGYGDLVEVPDDLLKRYEDAETEFHAVQGLIAALPADDALTERDQAVRTNPGTVPSRSRSVSANSSEGRE